jgi:hypothetical protein
MKAAYADALSERAQAIRDQLEELRGPSGG